MKKVGIKIHGRPGRWDSIDELYSSYFGKWVYLLKPQSGSRNDACIIIDENKKTIIDGVRNGFDDLEDYIRMLETRRKAANNANSGEGNKAYSNRKYIGQGTGWDPRKVHTDVCGSGSCVRVPGGENDGSHREDLCFEAENLSRSKQSEKTAGTCKRLTALVCAAALASASVIPAFAAGMPEHKSIVPEKDYSSVIFVPVEESPYYAVSPERSEEIEALAKMLWGEARGVKSTTEKAACCWVVFNRADNPRWPDNVIDVLEQKYQFGGYSADNPINEDLRELAEDVYRRWLAEKDGYTNVGRVIPKTYYFWCGDKSGRHNWFWEEFEIRDYYTWEMESPYED